jgi:hypothetical protein
VTPEADPEKIIRKGKTSQEGTSTVVPGNSGNLHDPSLKTPLTSSSSPILLAVGVSRILNFGSFPVDFSPPSLGIQGEIFDTPFSPEVVKWKERDLTLEDFPTLDFTTPPIRVVAVTEGETSVTSSPSYLSPNTQPFPFSPRSTTPVSPVQTPSPPGSPPVHVQMAGANPPRNMMAEILAARYAPLVLPQPMNALPATEYLKYMPQFTREGDMTAEEHLSSFYRFAEIQAIENEDVWMRVFVQSLDGDARDWFKDFPPRSVDEIDALDDSFLRHWGNKKYLLYYITELGT